MTVLFESKEERDAAAPARVLTPVMVDRRKSEMHARRSLLIRILALVEGYQRCVDTQLEMTAHPFQISVREVETMHIRHTIPNVNQLEVSVKDLRNSNNVRTSLVRFTLGFFRTKSFMLLFSIHSETITSHCPASVTPSSGRMFGCWRCFQATASLQNFCNSLV